MSAKIYSRGLLLSIILLHIVRTHTPYYDMISTEDLLFSMHNNILLNGKETCISPNRERNYVNRVPLVQNQAPAVPIEPYPE